MDATSSSATPKICRGAAVGIDNFAWAERRCSPGRADDRGRGGGSCTRAAGLIPYEEYHPYGSTAYHAKSSGEVSGKRYRYTGMEKDEETGLSYHHHRYLAVWLGRWCSSHPIGLGVGSTGGHIARETRSGRLDTNGKRDWPWAVYEWRAPQQRDDGLWYQDRIRIQHGSTRCSLVEGVLLNVDDRGRITAHDGPLGTVKIAAGDIRSQGGSTQLQVDGKWHDWSSTHAYASRTISTASYYKSGQYLAGGRNERSNRAAQTFVGAAFVGVFGALGTAVGQAVRCGAW